MQMHGTFNFPKAPSSRHRLSKISTPFAGICLNATSSAGDFDLRGLLGKEGLFVGGGCLTSIAVVLPFVEI
jgi:hypothetical protein